MIISIFRNKFQKGEKISFSFVIHNLEGEDTQYPYIVYFKSQDGQITKIEEKSVLLGDGEFKTINESYTSALPDNAGGIYVELTESATRNRLFIGR